MIERIGDTATLVAGYESSPCDAVSPIKGGSIQALENLLHLTETRQREAIQNIQRSDSRQTRSLAHAFYTP